MAASFSTNQSDAAETTSAQPCRELCRFVSQPFSRCHCFAITSAKVSLALYFCGGHYRECSIYQQHLDSTETANKASEA